MKKINNAWYAMSSTFGDDNLLLAVSIIIAVGVIAIL